MPQVHIYVIRIGVAGRFVEDVSGNNVSAVADDGGIICPVNEPVSALGYGRWF